MKKKKIEALPPIELRESRKTYYRMVADLVEIDGEEHLICDVYKRDEDAYIWIRRAAYTEKDHALWYPEEKKWCRKKLCTQGHYYHNVPEYDDCGMLRGPGIPDNPGWKNTAADQATQDAIKDFCEEMHATYRNYAHKGEWYKHLYSIEEEIKSQKQEKEMAARMERLHDRCENMPDIPEDFEDWADLHIFNRKEYIYYKRNGSRADCQCSKCGGSYTIRIKRPESFEGQFLKVHAVPRDKDYTHCELCGTGAVYKPRGRMRCIYGEKNHAYLIQPFKETGTVVRYFDIHKEWCLEGKSYIKAYEIGRTFFDVYSKSKTDWNLHDNFGGRDRWCDHNIGGMYNLSMREGFVYRRNQKEWQNTIRMRYSGFEEYGKHFTGMLKPCCYLQFCQSYQLEKLVKIGLFNITRALVSGEDKAFHKSGPNGKVENILRIRRCRLGMLEKMESMALLRALQLERIMTEKVEDGKARGKGAWTDEEIQKARAMGLSYEAHKTLFKYMTITQLINRIERYIERPIITTVMRDDVAHQKVEFYRDYLKMRIENEMDMERSTSIFPKDLQKAHAEVVRVVVEQKDKKQMEAFEKRFPEIKRKYRKLKAMYGFKSEGLFLRPAKDVREIIEEGRTLHHCVGATDTYFEKHNKGESFIFFIRRATDPNTPYITVEADAERMRQWYGAYDKKPDAEIIEKFLAEWRTVVAERRKKPQKEIAKSADQQILAEAV